jgi:ribosomal protein S17E
MYTTCFLNCLRLHISHTIEQQSNKILSNFEHNKNVFVKCLIDSMTKYTKSICHGYHLLSGEMEAT